jgi:hypothetical protein
MYRKTVIFYQIDYLILQHHNKTKLISLKKSKVKQRLTTSLVTKNTFIYFRGLLLNKSYDKPTTKKAALPF